MTEPDARRQELAAFLRSRRERISPEQVDLPVYGRRRTPGLRREEVAQLAGVGTTWYTWLEQGRDINPSAQVLEAVSRTLMLDAREREHLFTLAGLPLAPSADAAGDAVPERLQLVLDALDPFPAVVMSARRDVLAYNRAYDRVIGPIDGLGPDERNALWRLFTDDGFRERFVDWDNGAQRLVAQFRHDLAEHVGDPSWTGLVERLAAASPDFVRMWERHDIAEAENRTKLIDLPGTGLLRLDFTHLWLGPRGGVRMTTYTPACELTRQRLLALAERPPLATAS